MKEIWSLRPVMKVCEDITIACFVYNNIFLHKYKRLILLNWYFNYFDVGSEHNLDLNLGISPANGSGLHSGRNSKVISN